MGVNTSTWMVGFGDKGFAVQAFLITIAAILGTGILALPVKLARSGFGPFLFVFVFCLLMQIAVVCLLVEVLQRARARLLFRERHGLEGRHAAGLTVAPTGPAEDATETDLHTVGKLYLGPTAQRVFDASVLLHFLFVLVSYSLAGSLAYSQTLKVDHQVMIAPFVLVLAAVIVTAGRVIRPLVSALTFGKCTLLIVMIAVVGVVASEVHLTSTETWSSTLESFLMGTVALGGVVNVMPVTFVRAPFTPSGIALYRGAVIAGVCVCWVLNVAWAYFILELVPQTEAAAQADTAHPQLATLGVSLTQAEDHGEIATVPAIKVIKAVASNYGWVADTVTAFIILSISVSFVTIGTALRHVLDGITRGCFRDSAAVDESGEVTDASGTELHGEGASDVSWWGARVAACSSLYRVLVRPCLRWGAPWLWNQTGFRWTQYVGWFGGIMGIALLNPQGFLVVLEVFTSLALNTAAGILVAFMYLESTCPTAASSVDSKPQGFTFGSLVRRVLSDLCGARLAVAARVTRSARSLVKRASSSIARRAVAAATVAGVVPDADARRSRREKRERLLETERAAIDENGAFVGDEQRPSTDDHDQPPTEAGAAAAGRSQSSAHNPDSRPFSVGGVDASPKESAIPSETGDDAASDSDDEVEEAIPLPLGSRVGGLFVFVTLSFFGFAILYDVLNTFGRWFGFEAAMWLALGLFGLWWIISARVAALPSGCAWYDGLLIPPQAPPLRSYLTMSLPREASFLEALGDDSGTHYGTTGARSSRESSLAADELPLEPARPASTTTATSAAAVTGVAASTERSSLLARWSSRVLWQRLWQVLQRPSLSQTILPIFTVVLGSLAMMLASSQPPNNVGALAAKGFFVLSLSLMGLADVVRRWCKALDIAVMMHSFAWEMLIPVPLCLWADALSWSGVLVVLCIVSSSLEVRVHHARWSARELTVRLALATTSARSVPPATPVPFAVHSSPVSRPDESAEVSV